MRTWWLGRLFLAVNAGNRPVMPRPRFYKSRLGWVFAFEAYKWAAGCGWHKSG